MHWKPQKLEPLGSIRAWRLGFRIPPDLAPLLYTSTMTKNAQGPNSSFEDPKLTPGALQPKDSEERALENHSDFETIDPKPSFNPKGPEGPNMEALKTLGLGSRGL